ncbi:hypothetical protein [Glaciihabitans tibetensis]|uniref:hypothetical protein n=1 Tax=Glaciihabitans tibetensis TaxID=1266600 RepID=UPI0015E765FA|nr:hypothetical protein [Glaciihabitans tibetensis]
MALQPVMALWRKRAQTRRNELPRPTDGTHVEAHGENSDWILIVGHGLARGWGVRSHTLGLPGQVARELTTLTGRGSDIDVTVADDHAAIARVVASSAQARYHAIVVVSGATDAVHLRSPASWRSSMAELVDSVAAQAVEGASVVITGIPHLRSVDLFDSAILWVAAEHAAKLNAITRELCENRLGVSYVELPSTLPASQRDELRAAENYRIFGAAIAASLLPHLRPAGSTEPAEVALRRVDGVPRGRAEAARQSAVDSLPPLEGAAATEVQRLVAAAKAVYKTSFAAFTLVDADLLHHKVGSGIKPSSVPRSDSICTIAMHNSETTIVADVMRDARFRHLRGVRFYAGHPIVSATGHPVGMLCVVDTEPRDAASFDTTMLRELAAALQKRLWLAAADGQPNSQPNNQLDGSAKK